MHEYLELANIPYDKNDSINDEFKSYVIKGLDLEKHLDRYLKELSQGQFQKVKLATCLLQMTDYIILDEPFAHLDLVQKRKNESLYSRIGQREK